MQTTIDEGPQSALAGATWHDRLSCWIDASWFIPVLLVTFVVAWTAIFSIAYDGSDVHRDTLETWSVGRVFAWGFWKHPPLMGWIASGWLDVFPLSNWSFRLLSMTNAVLGLYAVDLIARRLVDKEKRVLILLLLLLTPAYLFHAENFNANSVLLAVWPLATYCFLRSFEQRTVFWAIAAGVSCAIVMLGKYYSIFLLAGFVIAAISHPDRRTYLKSSAPWISLFAGIAAIAPHVYWLATTGFDPFHYATLEHGGRTYAASAWGALMFVLTNAAYLILPTLALIYVMPSALSRDVLSRARLTGGALLLAIVFAAGFLLPMVVVIAMHSDLPTTWHLQGLFMIIVVAVAVLPAALDRARLVNLCGLTAALWLTGLAVAPIHALYRNYVPLSHGHRFYHQAAEALTQEWHAAYGTPLTLVSGDDGLAFAAAFYSADHPVYARPLQYQYMWGTPRRSTLQKGWSALCYVDDGGCLGWMDKIEKLAPDARRTDMLLTNRIFGFPGASVHVIALMTPPPATEPEPDSDVPDNGGVTDLSAHRRKSE